MPGNTTSIEAEKFSHKKPKGKNDQYIGRVAAVKEQLDTLRSIKVTLEEQRSPAETTGDDEAYIKIDAVIMALEWILDGFQNPDHLKRPAAVCREFMSRKLLVLTEPDALVSVAKCRAYNGRGRKRGSKNK